MTDKPYTVEDCIAEIGDSTSFDDARKASLKKWEQIAAGDYHSYEYRQPCGYCYVKDNRVAAGYPSLIDTRGPNHCNTHCPIGPTNLCQDLADFSPEQVIQAIKDLVHPEEEAGATRKSVFSIHWLASGNIGISRIWLDDDGELRSALTIYTRPTPASLRRLSCVVHRLSVLGQVDTILPAQPSEGEDGWLIFTKQCYYTRKEKRT